MLTTKKNTGENFTLSASARRRGNKNHNTITDILFGLAIAGACMLLMSMSTLAQNVGINNPAPHAKSLLDLTSTDKGLLAPRMTQAQRLAMFAANDATAKGMLVYQTDNTQGFYYYDGAVWQLLDTNAGWGLTGNAGTNTATNFMGTTDNKDVLFKANNAEMMRLRADNKILMGNSNVNPSYFRARLSLADENGTNSDIGLRVAGSSYSQVVFDQSAGTLASPSASAAGNWTGVVVGRGYDGTQFTNSSAMILGIDSAVAPGTLRGNIQFQTTGGTQLEKMRITKDGNVGIGTTNPGYKLSVVSSGYVPMSIQNTIAGGYSGMHFLTASGTMAGHIGYANSSAATFTNQVYAGSIAAIPFVLTTANLERMRIDANGDIGIDTTAPKARLHVKSNSASTWPQLLLEERDSLDYSRISFANKGINKYWTVAATSAVVDSNSRLNIFNSNTGDLMTLLGNGRMGLSNTNPIAAISTNNALGEKFSMWHGVNTCFGIGIQPGLLQLHTANVNDDVVFGYGSSGSMTETMRVKGNGNVGIGTNAPLFPLSFNNNFGDKIGLWGGAGNHCGIGVQPSLVQIYGVSSNDDIAFGYGSSSSLTETMRIKGNGNVGIGNNAPLYPLSFASTWGDKISLWGGAGAHCGIGVQWGLLQFYNPNVNDDIVFGYGSSAAFTENMRIKGSGNVGIGNNAPLYPLSFNSTYGDKISLWGGAGAHCGIGVQPSLVQIYGVNSNDDIVFGYGSSSSLTETMRIKGNGNVGIKTSTPTTALEVNGYTKLGSDAPAIKVKKFTAVTPASQGGQITITHGLDASKILSVNVVIEYGAGNYVTNGYTWSAGFESSVYYTTTTLFITNKSANSANILLKPCKVLVTYEE